MKVRVKISSLVINKSINSSVYHFHFSKNRSLFEIQLESRAKRTVFTMLKLVKIPKSGIGFDVFEREKKRKENVWKRFNYEEENNRRWRWNGKVRYRGGVMTGAGLIRNGVFVPSRSFLSTTTNCDALIRLMSPLSWRVRSLHQICIPVVYFYFRTLPAYSRCRSCRRHRFIV